MANTPPSPDEVNLPGRIFFGTGLQSQISGAGLRLGQAVLTTDNWWGHLGDESQNPPAWPTNKTIGDFDWTNLDPRFNNINIKSINHLDPQSWIYQFITGTNNPNPVITVITTALTFKVYGAGADFANFDAAYAWLSQRTISSTGSVTFVLPAGKIAINKRISLVHPNGSRVFIIGQPLNQALPAENTLQITGNSVAAIQTDVAVNLGRLRQSFSTELTFTNGGGIDIIGDIGLWQDILCTADQSVAPGASASNLINLTNSNATVTRSACVGANFGGFVAQSGCSVNFVDHFYSLGNGFSGINVQVGTVLAITGNIATCSNGFLFSPGTGTGGLVVAYGSVFYAIAFLNQKSYIINMSGNVGAGLICVANGSFSAGTINNIIASYNSVSGLQIGAGSNGTAQNTTMVNNGQYGAFAASNSTLDISYSSITGGQYAAYAGGGAQIYRTGVSASGQSVAAYTPALNTVGNSNALIT
jgi:hypothetical protein